MSRRMEEGMGSIVEIEKGKYRLFVSLGSRGKRRRRRSKTVHAKNETEARKMLIDFHSEVRAEKIIDEMMTIDDFYSKWKTLYAKDHFSKRQYREMCRIIDKRILPEFTTATLEEITTLDIVGFLKTLKRQDGKKGSLSPSTVHNIYKAFDSLMTKARDWKLIEENPCDDVDLPSVKYKEAEVYNVEETNKLFNRLDDYPWHWQLIVKVAALTGARQGEIVAIENKHFDFTENTLQIEQALTTVTGEGLVLKGTKTGNSRTISVPEILMKELYEYTKIKKKQLFEVQNLREWPDHTFIFSNEFGTPIRPDTVSQWWRRFMDDNNDLKRIRFHDLRHTSATLLLLTGVHEKVIQKRLGHSNVAFTLNTYSHVLEEMDRTASDKFDDMFNSTNTNKNKENDAK